MNEIEMRLLACLRRLCIIQSYDRGGYDDRRGGYDDRRGGYDDHRRDDVSGVITRTNLWLWCD